jgi:uncharacterized protein DUF3263
VRSVNAARGLSEQDRTFLIIERAWYRRAGSKEQRIRAELGISAARYYQLLNALIDRPEALAADPMLVGKLRRQRDRRTAGPSEPIERA